MKKAAILCVAWIAFLISILNVIPLSQSMRVIPDRVYYPPERAITIKKETTDVAMWSLSKTMEIDFPLSGLTDAYDVTTAFEIEILSKYSRWQETKIIYDYICNGKTFRGLRMDLVGDGSMNVSGGFPENLEPLDKSLLKSGDNQFKLRISVISTCDELCSSDFDLTIKDLRVQNHVLDLDEDGIWDNVDLVPMNNYVCTVLLGLLSTPIVGYAGLVLRRRHHR